MTKRSLRDRALPLALVLPLLAGACAGVDNRPVVANEPAVNLVRLARTAEAKGDPMSAAALYQQAHIVNPAATEPLLALGANLRSQEQDEAAAEVYRRALAIDSRNGEALRGFGMALVAMDQPAAALDQFNSALHVDSRDARAWNGRGVALDMLGRHPEAQHAYRTGLGLKQDDAALQNNLVLSQTLAPQTTETAPAAPRRPNNSPARANLAQATTAPAPAPAPAATPTAAPGGWTVLKGR